MAKEAESPAIAVTQEPYDDPRTPLRERRLPRPPALRALTSIRFFAALHVALYHMVRPFWRWGPLAGAMSTGYTGVSFFFVLSGFILTYAHAEEYQSGLGNKARFWLARFARIYPVYALCILLAALIGMDALRAPLHWVALAADFLMLQAWSMRMVNFFLSGAWTLSCEAFFYLLFPFLLLPLRPRSARGAWLSLSGFYLLSIAIPVALAWRFPGAAAVEEPRTRDGAAFSFLVSRSPLFAIPQFLAGMSLGWIFLRFRPSVRASSLMANAGAVLLLTALLLAGHLPYLPLHNGLLIPIYALLLLGLAERNWLSRVLGAGWLVLLGESSFALYLCHSLLLTWTERWVPEQTFLTAVWRVPLAIALSIAIHLLVERPCRRVILRWWAARHPLAGRMSSA